MNHDPMHDGRSPLPVIPPATLPSDPRLDYQRPTAVPTRQRVSDVLGGVGFACGMLAWACIVGWFVSRRPGFGVSALLLLLLVGGFNLASYVACPEPRSKWALFAIWLAMLGVLFYGFMEVLTRR